MDLLDISVRSSVVLLAALAASVALGRRAAAFRHRVLAAGVFSAALVVPFGLTLPAWDAPILSQPPIAAPASPPDAAVFTTTADHSPQPLTAVPVLPLAAGVWLLGFAASLALMLARFRHLARLTRRATPIDEPRWLKVNREVSAQLDVRSRVPLLRTDGPDVPATWGVLRPCVLLPPHVDTWSHDRIVVVLAHELAHIRRYDWGVQIGAELVRAVFWFNPLFWIACSRLRRESELACDSAVIESGVAPAEYAAHLVDIARACRPVSSNWAPALPIARPSTLEWRITAMLNPATPHPRPSRRAMTVAVVALVAVSVSVATFRASAQSSPLPLSGTVYDMTGAVLPQVNVSLEDVSGVARTAVTDGSGRFEFDAVEPGGYVLRASLPGFLTLTQELTLKDPRHWERAITLQVGTVQERITVRDGRSDAPVTAAVAAEPVRVGGNIKPPRKIVDMRPDYPQAMLDGGFEGVVPMEALIGVDGKVASVRMSSAQVHPALAQAAVDAVRQWVFTPTLLNGVAVEVRMTVAVDFKRPE